MISRRDFLASLSAAWAARRLGAPVTFDRPVPTSSQLDWQRDELAMFAHFGVNTFTNREWGDGREDPSIFAPAALDPRQWTRAAREAGFRAMILTAKHHDGFCLWPTSTSTHSVASAGAAVRTRDVVREFTDACRAEGLRAGLYLSPWDRNHPTYGDSPAYNDVYVAQLTELLSRYGTISEVWFDGANGEGPNGKRQQYDWPRFIGTVRRLQPDAVMFSDAGPDVRWCGNERGEAGDPNWSTMDPSAVPYPGADGPGIIAALQHGDPAGNVWRPAETDVSIRPGWFHHPEEDARVRDADNLLRLYAQSVGRNSKLLLNVPPTRDGVLHPNDVASLNAFARLRAASFDTKRIHPREEVVSVPRRTMRVEQRFTRPTEVRAIRASEDIAHGQNVSRYSVSGLTKTGWRELSAGTTIGYAKIDQLDPVLLTAIRLDVLDTVGAPRGVKLESFQA
ncbi:MAG TPA: alpha-L-fucosidase [Gemmatimonadaceae bacterium]|nr:alpha-L-fucosidase [Gemmatimonadaceae bacterium]